MDAFRPVREVAAVEIDLGPSERPGRCWGEMEVLRIVQAVALAFFGGDAQVFELRQPLEIFQPHYESSAVVYHAAV